eukprot:7715713-Pyramimonas_sp.AAC.1
MMGSGSASRRAASTAQRWRSSAARARIPRRFDVNWDSNKYVKFLNQLPLIFASSQTSSKVKYQANGVQWPVSFHSQETPRPRSSGPSRTWCTLDSTSSSWCRPCPLRTPRLALSSGVFSPLWQAWSGPQGVRWPLQIVTWNARALFHHNLPSRQAKFSILHRLLRPGAVVAIQESHGTELEIRDFLYQSHLDFLGASSFAPNSQAGGVITFLPKFTHLTGR